MGQRMVGTVDPSTDWTPERSDHGGLRSGVRRVLSRSPGRSPRKKLKKPSGWSIRSMGQEGEGKRTPVITSPLSFDLTGVRFQRRVSTTRRSPQRITRQVAPGCTNILG